MTHPVRPWADSHARFILCVHLGAGHGATNPTADPSPIPLESLLRLFPRCPYRHTHHSPICGGQFCIATHQ